MILPVDRVGEPSAGKPTIVILHGLLGNRRDWCPIARRLAHAATFIIPDLPNHGDAPHLDPFTAEATCQIIRETIRREAPGQPILFGHSLGGKLAMRLARDTPEAFSKLIVADISPRAIPPLHLFILRACLALDLSAHTTRPSLDAALAQTLPDPALRAYLLRGITRTRGHFVWNTPLDLLERHPGIVSDSIEFPTPCPLPTHLIIGGQSTFITPRNLSLFNTAFSDFTSHTLPNSGHMLHADAPQALAELLETIIL